ALLRATVTVGVLARLHHRLLGDAIDVAAAAAKAARGGENLLVARARRHSTLYSGHRALSLCVRQQRLDRRRIDRGDLGGAAQLTLVLGGLLREDVALERLRTLDAARRADAEPLRGPTLRLHLRHDCP